MPFSKHRRGHTFFMILFFVCFGMTAEVFFTAFLAFFTGQESCGKPRIALEGHTYVWMAFIYALIPILGFFFYEKVSKISTPLRLLMYVLLLYFVEFTSGYLLERFTGACPWKYVNGWHIMGYIRLDYFPAWMFFVWFVEKIYVFINNRVIQ